MSRTTEAVVGKQRKIQSEQDARDAQPSESPDSEQETVQTGARDYPTQQPAQHLPKPGLEADLQQKPQFEAPDYRGSGKLQGMATLITGGDSGIGRAVAVLFAREGADVAFVLPERRGRGCARNLPLGRARRTRSACRSSATSRTRRSASARSNRR